MFKFFNYKKKNNYRTLNIFGIPIYTRSVDYNTNTRSQSFLFNLIKTIKTGDIYAINTNKKIQLFGLNILSKEIKQNNIQWKFFGINIKHDNLYDKFKKKYFKYFDKEHDDIYLLNANSGEIYLFLTYCLDACIKKYGSKKPLLVATKQYHVELIKMICPDIDYIYIKQFNMLAKSDTVDYRIDNFRFFQIFSYKHFLQVEIDIKKDETANFFKSILEELNLKLEDLEMRNVSELQSSKESMLQKITKIGLNIDNFILIAPEAHSCSSINNEYWNNLIREYTQKGYDVFVNLIKNEIDLTGANYKTCYLTYSEIYSLAKRAKKIIMLRSGLTELFLQTNVPMEVLYTKFRDRILINSMEVEQVKRGFSLKNIPYNHNFLIEKMVEDNKCQS